MMDAAKGNILSNYIIPSLISIGVSVPLFVETALVSTLDPDDGAAFYSLSYGWRAYVDFKTAWKPRLFSNGLAALTSRLSEWILSKTNVQFILNPLELTVALWTIGWFLLICLALILFRKRRAIFYIFGMFAGLSYGYMPRLSTRIYPWDLPALFIFTLFVLLYNRDKYKWLFALVPLGMGFKETSLILCMVFLFSEMPRKNRWILLLGSGTLCVGIKVMLDLFVHVPTPFFTMENGFESSRVTNYYIIRNLIGLRELVPFFINAGTLLAFLLLPVYNHKILGMKFIAGLFMLGNLLFGNIFEYRIWFEMIPFALYGIEIASFGSEAPALPQSESA
jgi:hypothetical protein